MPHKTFNKFGGVPRWIDDISDRCLRTMAGEAWWARRRAAESGAETMRACKPVLKVGDEILEAIIDGRVKGEVACRKAADALRKYTSALECASPTKARR